MPGESGRLILPRGPEVINPREVRIHFEDNRESFPENYPSKEGPPKIACTHKTIKSLFLEEPLKTRKGKSQEFFPNWSPHSVDWDTKLKEENLFIYSYLYFRLRSNFMKNLCGIVSLFMYFVFCHISGPISGKSSIEEFQQFRSDPPPPSIPRQLSMNL